MSMSSSDFWLGSPGRFQQQSTLGKEQQGLYHQLLGSAGGAFGDVGQYYRDLLSNRGGDFSAFAAPEMRRFQEEIIPSLAEQFAGAGHGSVGGSGFRNAAIRAGTDLSERLGAIRAGLRQNAAQGLMGLGQQGLGNYNENLYFQPTNGFFGNLATGLGQGAGMALGAL